MNLKVRKGIEIKRRFVELGDVAKGQSSKICGGKYNLVLTSESIEKSRLQRNKKLLDANDLLMMTQMPLQRIYDSRSNIWSKI